MHQRRSDSPPSANNGRPSRNGAIVKARTKSGLSSGVVVGIGASVGSLDAVKAFLAAVPPDTGLTFVVVVQLDPTRETFVPALITRGMALHAEVACDGQTMLPNHVYIIPSNCRPTIEHGRIRVRQPRDRHGLRGTIDRFFCSLARNEHERAICIILSGTGNEGIIGARAVKAEGGTVIAQAPETAVQPDMPASVIATGLVDLILAPDAMPEALLNSIRRPDPSVAAEPKAAQSMTIARRLTAGPDVATNHRRRVVDAQKGSKADLQTATEDVTTSNQELSVVNQQLQWNLEELTDLANEWSNLLAATDIAILFVDAHLRLRRFTDSAARLLNLLPSDIGRPIEHLETGLVDCDLACEAERVLSTGAIVEKSVPTRGRRHCIVRILPSRREAKTVNGVVVTLTDVTELRESEQELHRLNRILEERIRDRTRHLLMLHDVARSASEASRWDEALTGVLRRFCSADRWQIGYVHLPAVGSTDLIPAIVYVEGERYQPFHQRTPRRLPPGAGVPGRVYAEGKLVWTEQQSLLVQRHPLRAAAIKAIGLQSGAALPLVSRGETIGVLELFSTSRRQCGEELTHLLTDVAGLISNVIDREQTMSQAAALVWREQQNLVHTLHDSIGQQLTGIGMLSSALKTKLKDADGEVREIVSQIAQQAQVSIDQVRRLSRGLFPVEVDADGLVHALQRLATTTSSLGQIRCTVEETGRVHVRDNQVATELYRIAQEAVTNALKHARAQNITVRLTSEAASTILSVADDGRGVPMRPASNLGMGLRIMRYRAQTIGASLTVESTPEEGTVITCLLGERPLQVTRTNEG